MDSIPKRLETSVSVVPAERKEAQVSLPWGGSVSCEGASIRIPFL